MSHNDPWDSGIPYEPFMGRWSRKIAPLFLGWLDAPPDLRWLDVGCGTGALSMLIAARTSPQAVLGIDLSPAFIAHAAKAAGASKTLRFEVAAAEQIPAEDRSFDRVVSALAFNFFPDPVAALDEMRRVTRPGGEIALYVWDYSLGMQMLRIFWDVVVALDSSARLLDEQVRFPLCRPQRLRVAFSEVDLGMATVQALETATIFRDIDDYWLPFQGGVGPAPAYVANLSEGDRLRLEAALRARLPIGADGSIALTARAWGIRARRVD